MLIYDISTLHILIEKREKVYFIWDPRVCEITCIDKFIIKNKRLKPIGIVFKSKQQKPLRHVPVIVKESYYYRKGHRQLQPEQLLTHPNPHIRNFIKELINENLSSP